MATPSIRILKDVDPAVAASVTAEQLTATVAQISSSFPPLYARGWCPQPIPTSASNVEQPELTVLQYNLLAEGLSYPKIPPPFPENVDGDQLRYYGGFDNVPDPETVFDFSKRKFRLLEEILKVNASIITLEECDHYHSFFAPALAKFGYEGLFQPKVDAPGLSTGYYSDGVAVLWKADTFSLAGSATGTTVEHEGKPVKCTHVVVSLELKSAKRVVVATTHLKAKPSNEGIRVTQLQGLFEVVGEMRRDHDAVVFAGDLNSDPYAVTHKGTSIKPAAVQSILKSSLGLSSSYPIPLDDTDPAYTTWKSRGTDEVRHVIDYIFHSPELDCTKIMEPPVTEDLETAKLPGLRAPSDHLPIAAVFRGNPQWTATSR